MNKENASKLWKMIQEAGDYLLGQLPAIQIILKEETPTLMLLYVSKRNLSNSYKDIPDDKFQEVVDYINFLKENPS